MPIRRRRYKKNVKSYVPSIYRRRSATTNYFRMKIDYIDRIAAFSDTPPVNLYYKFAFGGGSNANAILTVADILTGNSQFAKLADVFAMCKLRAVSIEAAPADAAGQLPYPVSVCYFNSEVLAPTYAQIAECPAGMMLDATKKKTKYVSLLGNTADWVPVAAASFLGRFAVGQEFSSGGLGFNVKISLYMVFKQSLI